MPDLILKRFAVKYHSTIGGLYLPSGEWLCFTLEDEERNEKVHGQTCVPAGRYEVRLTPSARFGRVLPELIDVPDFTGIRMHSGVTIEHTLGCILVGFGISLRQHMAMLQYSREAVELVVSEIERLVGYDKVFIDVSHLT